MPGPVAPGPFSAAAHQALREVAAHIATGRRITGLLQGAGDAARAGAANTGPPLSLIIYQHRHSLIQ